MLVVCNQQLLGLGYCPLSSPLNIFLTPHALGVLQIRGLTFFFLLLLQVRIGISLYFFRVSSTSVLLGKTVNCNLAAITWAYFFKLCHQWKKMIYSATDHGVVQCFLNSFSMGETSKSFIFAFLLICFLFCLKR